MTSYKPIPYRHATLGVDESFARGREFRQLMDTRRSVRQFADRDVPREWIEIAIETASSAPSGAHRQPWHFVAVHSAKIKQEIRAAAEAEEKQSYQAGRMPEEWLQALEPIGTNWVKPHLDVAPWLVVVFEEIFGADDAGNTRKNYYVKESVGIACGLFITAIHQMGLVTLTHTPSPMAFLSKILGRPANERPYILFPVGYPAADAEVPDLQRKPLSEVSSWLE